eukprot:CAMPEP_0178946296 /NCGR_PEP_ID=MMETSP0789-20121207/4207_1 /TAXON_ID=3005 /ORGANISM="Rhizosolenia setigera, Strain CCMP 1694" /LENGTH=386 /DNA_ID=CAMNT_0020626273 /DNA_START=173 /DNA_END=1333 /DNA_ORIENTATION=+
MSSNTTPSLFYNRETSKLTDFTTTDIVKKARILSLSDLNDKNSESLHSGELPEGCELLQIGATLSDFDLDSLKKNPPNVLFVSHPNARETMWELLFNQFQDSIEWVHTRSAGIDFIMPPTAVASSSSSTENTKFVMTNAKGLFSSTLAEYSMMACSYFAKDLPRLMKQKKDKNWEKYCVKELRGSTFGVIGYGDIGKACARLAKAYGMNIIALKRNPPPGKDGVEVGKDELCDTIYYYGDGKDEEKKKKYLHKLLGECDYTVIALPLTEETKGMIDKEALGQVKKDSVIINVGRGPLIDEDALIEALEHKNGNANLKGAGLDVFSVEPLPKESKLWELDNVLVSPHNMDATETFMEESTEFFVKENLNRYTRGLSLLNPVDYKLGY